MLPQEQTNMGTRMEITEYFICDLPPNENLRLRGSAFIEPPGILIFELSLIVTLNDHFRRVPPYASSLRGLNARVGGLRSRSTMNGESPPALKILLPVRVSVTSTVPNLR